MSRGDAGTAEPGGAVESRPSVEAGGRVEPMEAVEPGMPMKAAGAKSEAGKPAKGIAEAVIRPIIVTGPALGIVAASRPDAAVTRGQGVSGRADWLRLGRAQRRSAQHGRRRGRGVEAGWIRLRHRN